jgi:hypothetical protein
VRKRVRGREEERCVRVYICKESEYMYDCTPSLSPSLPPRIFLSHIHKQNLLIWQWKKDSKVQVLFSSCLLQFVHWIVPQKKLFQKIRPFQAVHLSATRVKSTLSIYKNTAQRSFFEKVSHLSHYVCCSCMPLRAATFVRN